MKNPNFYTDYECPLAPGYFYHVYNRTNNKELLFRSDENRRYFLRKFHEYLSPFLSVYAYCLMGNHFHFLVYIHEEQILETYLNSLPMQALSKTQKQVMAQSPDKRIWSEVVCSQFQRFFTGYAMAVNKQWERSGNLFHRPFQRVAVKDTNHLLWLIYYLHANPKKHGIMADYKSYPWSSYAAFLSNSNTHLHRDEVLGWYGGKDAFLLFHQQSEDWGLIQDLMIEE